MLDLYVAYGATDRLRELLAAWDANVGGEDAGVLHRWTNLALWPAARNATVAGSTAIEGNPLTPAEVDEVLTGGHVDASRTAIREVLNYNAALDLANRASLRGDFEWSTELLRRFNAAILESLEDDERGEYRSGPVTVGGRYHPPESGRLPALMAALVTWLRAPTETHPLILAGLTHLNVVSIHPWLNGNGRTARVAGSLMLMRCGVGAPELLNIESEIRASRERYFSVLQESSGPEYTPHDHAATPWLEYYAEICVSRLDSRNRVVAAMPNDLGILLMETGGELGPDVPAILLSARLAPLRTSPLAASLGLSQPRTRALLGQLTHAGWLEPIGDRRGRRYVPSARLRNVPLRTPELMERMRNPAAN